MSDGTKTGPGRERRHTPMVPSLSRKHGQFRDLLFGAEDAIERELGTDDAPESVAYDPSRPVFSEVPTVIRPPASLGTPAAAPPPVPPARALTPPPPPPSAMPVAAPPPPQVATVAPLAPVPPPAPPPAPHATADTKTPSSSSGGGAVRSKGIFGGAAAEVASMLDPALAAPKAVRDRKPTPAPPPAAPPARAFAAAAQANAAAPVPAGVPPPIRPAPPPVAPAVAAAGAVRPAPPAPVPTRSAAAALEAIARRKDEAPERVHRRPAPAGAPRSNAVVFAALALAGVLGGGVWWWATRGGPDAEGAADVRPLAVPVTGAATAAAAARVPSSTEAERLASPELMDAVAAAGAKRPPDTVVSATASAVTAAPVAATARPSSGTSAASAEAATAAPRTAAVVAVSAAPDADTGAGDAAGDGKKRKKKKKGEGGEGEASATAAAARPAATAAPDAPDRGTMAKAAEAVAEGKRLLLSGAFDAAAASFAKAVTLEPGRAEAHRGLAVAEEKRGRTSIALKAYRTYLKLVPHAADRSVIEARIATLEGK